MYSFGIEEEYFVCCENTLAPATVTPESLFTSDDGMDLQREMLQAAPWARAGLRLAGRWVQRRLERDLQRVLGGCPPQGARLP